MKHKKWSSCALCPPPCILFIFAIFVCSEEVVASLIDIIIETLILQASVGGQLILLITWETGTIRLQSAAETIFNKHIIKKTQDFS